MKDCNWRLFVIFLLFFLLFLSFNHYFNISSQRLKKLIKGKNAYIVPGMINANDDLFLANELGMEYFKCSFHKYEPILCRWPLSIPPKFSFSDVFSGYRKTSGMIWVEKKGFSFVCLFVFLFSQWLFRKGILLSLFDLVKVCQFWKRSLSWHSYTQWSLVFAESSKVLMWLSRQENSIYTVYIV